MRARLLLFLLLLTPSSYPTSFPLSIFFFFSFWKLTLIHNTGRDRVMKSNRWHHHCTNPFRELIKLHLIQNLFQNHTHSNNLAEFSQICFPIRKIYPENPEQTFECWAAEEYWACSAATVQPRGPCANISVCSVGSLSLPEDNGRGAQGSPDWLTWTVRVQPASPCSSVGIVKGECSAGAQ